MTLLEERREKLKQLVQENYTDDGQIDVIEIARGFDIGVKYEEWKSLYSDFNAEIRFKDRSYIIFVNPNHSLTRQRFSIAHEIAHFVEHQDIINKEGSMSRSGNNDEEVLADEIAAEMLMPTDIVKNYLNNLRIGEESPINIDIIKEVSGHFKVSRIVAIIRLRCLKYRVPFIDLS